MTPPDAGGRRDDRETRAARIGPRVVERGHEMTRDPTPRTSWPGAATTWPRAYLFAGRLALAVVSAPVFSRLPEPVPISRTAHDHRRSTRQGFHPAEMAGPFVITLPHPPSATRHDLDGGARPPGENRLPPRSTPRRG